jgi:hypothetical protein
VEGRGYSERRLHIAETSRYRGRQYVQLSDACELTLFNGELRYPSQKMEYKDATAFIDVNDPTVLAVQIVPPPNPCEVAAQVK